MQKKDTMKTPVQNKIKFSNYFQYVDSASRTISSVIEEYESNIPKELGERFNVLHMGLGVATEYFELMEAINKKDFVNVSEEIGDIQWYIGNHLKMIFKSEDKIYEKLTEVWFKPQYSLLTVNEHMDVITNLFEKYTDMCKRHGAYNKKIDQYEDKLRTLAINISHSLVSILLNHAEVSPKQCLERNINKLLARYPDKFDQFLAMNRDLVAEREILEGLN